MYNPRSAALDAAGNLYISDYSRIRKVSNGAINTSPATVSQDSEEMRGPPLARC